MENELLSRENIPEEILEAFKENMKLSKKLMTYYSCALLEIETKFKVLNQQFSLEQEHNPIETIKTRLKSTESILEKLHRKNLPMDMAAVEENPCDLSLYQ